MGTVKYEHHGREVSVKEENKGKHRENCLCFECKSFNNCPTQERVYNTCVEYGIVSPVWECPDYIGD